MWWLLMSKAEFEYFDLYRHKSKMKFKVKLKDNSSNTIKIHGVKPMVYFALMICSWVLDIYN